MTSAGNMISPPRPFRRRIMNGMDFKGRLRLTLAALAVVLIGLIMALIYGVGTTRGSSPPGTDGAGMAAMSFIFMAALAFFLFLACIGFEIGSFWMWRLNLDPPNCPV